MKDGSFHEMSRHESFTERKKRQAAIKQFALDWCNEELGRNVPLHHITLATHDQICIEHARDLLKRWDAKMNHAIVGPNWATRVQQHNYWIAFLEGRKSDPHWHLVFGLSPKLPKRRREALNEKRSKYRRPLKGLKAVVDDTWTKTTRGKGTAKTVLNYDRRKLINYVTKEQHDPVLYENMVIYSQFKKDKK